MTEEKDSSTTGLDESQTVNKGGRPHYLYELEKRWVRWTGINDPDVLESLDYLSGDLFFEMRKLTSQICIENEDNEKVLVRKLDEILHFKGDKELTRKIGEVIFSIMANEKKSIKKLIDTCWRDIVDKQKVGIDKICIVVTKNIHEKVKEQMISINLQKNEEEKKDSEK